MKLHFYPMILDFRKILLLEGVCSPKSNIQMNMSTELQGQQKPEVLEENPIPVPYCPT
jgi:hypothetical protein